MPGIFSSDKYKKSDNTSKLPKKVAKTKVKNQTDSRRQAKVIEQKTTKTNKQ